MQQGQRGGGLPPVVIQQGPSGGGGGGNKGGGMGGLLNVVLSAALAIVVVWFVVIPMVAVTKTDYNALAAKVAQNTVDITNATTNVSGVLGKVANLEGDTGNTTIVRDIADLGRKTAPDLSGYATTASLSGYIKTADLAKWLQDNGYVKGGTTTTTTTGGGGTTTSDGLSFTLEKSSVISTQTTTSPGDTGMSVVIMNSSGVGKNVSMVISLEPLSPTAYAILNLSAYQTKSTLTGFTAYTNGSIQANPDVNTLVSKIVWIAPDFYLENGSSKTIWLFFNVKLVPVSDVVTWSLKVKAL